MKTYSEYLAGIFPGMKVQKISVNAGMSCPNRDGTIGTGGCSYCRVDSFTPSYCMEEPGVAAQIECGKAFFARKYPEMRYLAYFQSFTNTHGRSLAALEALYREALACRDVVGLIVGTRPDTLPDDVVGLLSRLAADVPVFVEIGAESTFDETLRRVNRGHTWAQTADAVTRCAAAGLHCGLHLIAGLPGEDDAMVMENVRRACRLPIETLKLHQLQIIEGTPLHRAWLAGTADVEPYTLERYTALCRAILRIIPEDVVVERWLAQSPPQIVAAPKWGIKNYQFNNILK